MLEIVLRQFARGPRVDLLPPLLRVTSIARNGRLSWDDTTEPSSESHILTEATQGPAASRARAGGVVNDVLARQVCRQSTAHRFYRSWLRRRPGVERRCTTHHRRRSRSASNLSSPGWIARVAAVVLLV